MTASLLWCVALLLPPPQPALSLTEVRLLPRAGHEKKLIGGRITGSNSSATNDFVTLAVVKGVPGDRWQAVAIPTGKVYRFVKFEAPNGSWANVAEVEFYHNKTRLTGTPFGTVGSRDGSGNTFDKALDGDPQTYFEGTSPNGQYVGLDLGESAQCRTPVATPPSGRHPQAVTVTLTTATPDAKIYYSTNGNNPADGGTLYTTPITIDKSCILLAVATRDGLGDSPLAVTAYNVGAATQNTKQIRSFHIGNSLTDTIDGWLEPVAQSAGRDYRFFRFTITGAPTDWLWDHPGQGFGESRYLEAFLAHAPLDHVVTQPFAGHNRSVENEATHSQNFFAAAQKHSPEVQPWLYVQWPDKSFSDAWSRAKPGDHNIDWQPAKTWQEAVANHDRYVNAVRAKVNRTGTRPVKVIPAGPALAELKTLIDAGKIPGVIDFFGEHFSDDLHLAPKGRYLVALVHYACLTGESPEGRVTHANTGLTAEQARTYQWLAWQAVERHPHAGVRPAE